MRLDKSIRQIWFSEKFLKDNKLENVEFNLSPSWMANLGSEKV